MGGEKGNAALKEEGSEVRKGVPSWERKKNSELQEWIKKKEVAGMQQKGFEGSREKR